MSNVEELFDRGIAAHQAGDLDVAERNYRQILAIDPQHAATLTNLGALLVRRGRLEEAARAYQASAAANPNLPATHFNLGNLCRQLGRYTDAARAFHRVIQLDPSYVPGHVNLGIALGQIGDWSGAVERFRRAVELDPNVKEGFGLLGDALLRVGRTEEAVAAGREFVRRSPDLPRSHLTLGLALLALGQAEEAILELENALLLRPEYFEAHNALGIARDEIGLTQEANNHFREAARIEPKSADVWKNLGVNLREQGRMREATEALAKALELRPDPNAASDRLLILLASSEVTSERLREEHEAWATKYAANSAPVAGSMPHAGSSSRLKIGYVFGELRTRAASTFLETLLTHHDRTRIHVTCYANTPRVSGAISRLRGLADDWRSVAGLADVVAATLIRSDEIDVLIDLCGHQAGNRLLTFAHKPARVQATLFGYPATTGLRAFDFRISDAIADPPGAADAHGPEKVLRLPRVGWLYVPPATAPGPNSLPAGSRRTRTFGCLNSMGKLSDACVELWVRVMKAVPASRLVVQAARSVEAARQLTERFSRLGLSSDRLELIYRMPEKEYLETYQSIDVALDPFPLNGRATTCDALWMGVPVLSVAGEDCRSRQGASILTNVGLPDFVADGPDKLIDLAATWAEQRDALADLRNVLREMTQQSPVTDAAGYVRDLEEAYRTMATTSTSG